MAPQTLADITPNGTKTQVITTETLATIAIFTATGTSCRIGDTNVGSARGAKLANGVPLVIESPDQTDGRIDLSDFWVFGASGSDAVSITWLP